MNEITRAAIILGVVGVALAAMWMWSSLRARSFRTSVRTEHLRPWPAVVLFTSTDCDACEPVRKAVFAESPEGVVREFVYQGSSDQFRSVGIRRVPAVVVVDGQGDPVGAYEGQVTARRIGRAVRRAGIR